MKKNIENNQKGITLIALTITIILLFILSGIAVYTGKDTIKRAKLEELKTNMLLIQTQAREFVENASFDLGIDPENATDEMKTKAQSELSGTDKGTMIEKNDSLVDDLLKIGISQSDIDNGNVYKLCVRQGVLRRWCHPQKRWYDLPESAGFQYRQGSQGANRSNRFRHLCSASVCRCSH